MFNENQQNPNETETIIGPSVQLEGDFVTEGNIIIEGAIAGTIKTKQHLQVERDAKITADVEANSVIVSGIVEGNMVVEGRLEITETGEIHGDINVGELIISAGSILNGRCQMGEKKEKTVKAKPATKTTKTQSKEEIE